MKLFLSISVLSLILASCSSPVDIDQLKTESNNEIIKKTKESSLPVLTPQPTPKPTSVPIQVIASEPTPEPTLVPVQVIVSEPTPEPTLVPIQVIVSEQTPEPSSEPTQVVVSEPSIINGNVVEFRSFIPGNSSYESVINTLEKEPTYRKVDFPNEYTIRALTDISGKDVMLNFYFHNKTLAIVDMMYGFDLDLHTDIDKFLDAKYGTKDIHGYYKYPNIKVDYVITCSTWGSKEPQFYPCTDSPIISDNDYSDIVEKLGLDYIQDPEYKDIVQNVIYQSPLLANKFREYRFKIAEEEDKQNILDEFDGEL